MLVAAGTKSKLIDSMKQILNRKRSSRIAIGLLVAATLPTSALLATANAVAAPPSDQQLSDATWIAAGREKFANACAYCHGSEGDSGKVQPFRERINWEPREIHDVITNGRKRGANIMPAWGGSIPDEEIWKIVAFIRSLSGKEKPAQ